MLPLRVATVPYLNIEPFVAALRAETPCHVVRAAPSALPQLLRSCQLDLCMLSTADLIAMGREPIAGASISCDGAVESVLLLAHEPPSRWTRVAFDPASSTSNQLAKAVLAAAYFAEPAFRWCADPLGALRRGEVDAAVVIGDRALDRPSLPVALDLGALWKSLTGLPFVFAAWVEGGGRRASRRSLEELLGTARLASRRWIAPCAARHAAASRLSQEVLERYLRERIRYRFAAPERNGLERFRSLLGPRTQPIVAAAEGAL